MCRISRRPVESIFNEEAYLKGGRSFLAGKQDLLAPDISSSQAFGIGHWSSAATVEYLKTGQTHEKRFIAPESCPVNFYRNGADSDLKAIAEYLRAP
jgi:hypothetical protein